MQNTDGQWVADPGELECMVTSYYKDLFRDISGTIPFCLRGAFPNIFDESLRLLDSGVTFQEIYQMIMNMGAFKAPGPDGFQAVFYQSQWETVGEAFCKLIMDIFENHTKVKDINKTLIALIPKVEDVVFMKQFRPISLCNVSYKIITKVLARRLRQIMEVLVSPCQCSFIPHRQSGDNIVIAQEVIHSMKNRKGAVGWMAIKIDLEKAYDRLNWVFIKDTLQDIGLPCNFISLVWECISTSTMKVLWNGEALEEFSPSSGIRQGDPISPYLFVLCIERLFHLINAVVENKFWSPIQLSRGGPKLSHLAFADDLMLFSEASIEQVEIIGTILKLFCDSSGQKVSTEKTRVFFSKNVNREKKKELSEALGFQCTDDLGKYLGAPLIHHRSSRQSYQFILDKVNQRLSNWKTSQLSFAGRVTLAKSVLQAMPSYVMQTASLPRALCDEIDRKCKNFIWGDTEHQRHMHLASWKSICTPKKFGGLGLRAASDINTSFMMKMGWNLCAKKDDMWVRILRSKYKCGSDIVPNIQTNRQGTNLWRGICKNWNLVEENLAWRVNNGRTVNFWTDSWIPNVGRLVNVSNVQVDQSAVGKHVSDYVTSSHQWNLNLIAQCVPSHIQECIKMIIPPNASFLDDSLAWEGSTDDTFSTGQAYLHIINEQSLQATEVFSYIWKWNGPERIRYFLWKCAHKVLMTNEVRNRRGFSESDLCPICQHVTESLLHMFRDCQSAQAVWNTLKIDMPSSFFDQDSFDVWLLNNLHSRDNMNGENWDLVFAVALDRLWLVRNEWVFKQSPPLTVSTVARVRRLVSDILGSVEDFKAMGKRTCTQIGFSNIRWECPIPGMVKLNCDGAVKSYAQAAACGGVLRDHNGAFLCGFAVKLGKCTVPQAELWAVIYGLRLAKDRGFSNIHVESDSLIAVNLINGGCLASHQCRPLVNEIKKLIPEVDRAQVTHVFWKANQVADCLATYALSLDMDCKIFDVIPDYLGLSLLGDVCKTIYPRGF